MTDDPIFLTIVDVLALHSDQIREFGGGEGLRDEAGLESAVAQARATYDGKYLHSGLFEMAAAYAFHIAENLTQCRYLSLTCVRLPSQR